MFKVEDFYDTPILRNIIVKLNKFQVKNKVSKISKIIKELEDLIYDDHLIVKITYIFSIIAEKNIELISPKLVNDIETFLHSEQLKLKINSIIIIGFFILAHPTLVKKYFFEFIKLLLDKSEDVRENAYYFLHKFIEIEPNLVPKFNNIYLKALSFETKKDNIITLLNLINFSDDLNFKQLYKFREISKDLIQEYYKDISSEIYQNLTILIKKFFPMLKEYNFETQKPENIIKQLENIFLMKKFNFNRFANKKKITLKDFLTKFKKSRLKDKEIYFYVKNNENKKIIFYELEKEKLNKTFDKNNKISLEKIQEHFSEIVENTSELKIFVKTLLKLGHIKGYLSKLFFYPYKYMKSEIIDKFYKKGIINIKKYNYLPQEIILNIINDAIPKEEILMGKNRDIFYSLKNIIKQISETSAKNSSIDLGAYRERLADEEFIKLIKNLPKEYLTKFHKGTNWLTNIGLIRVKTEIDNSKVIGFFDINRISDKLVMRKILLLDVLESYVDYRSGIWDKNKERFYYSKYLQKKIEKINLISENSEKEKQINLLANELNIDKNHILSKIDENYRLIGEEIKNQDEIKFSEYIEKTGFKKSLFMNFIDELGLNYFIKGDILILSSKKIEEAKKDIKTMLIQKSKTENIISLGNFEINSNLIEELIKDLQNDKKIKGIFYEENGDLQFYTEQGIKNLMLENSFLFSFHDLFYGKELNQKELIILKEIFEDLIKERKLRGIFDEETLTFSSDDIVFANDYNSYLLEFSRRVNKYIQKFNSEFQLIKKILTKKNDTIYPQEIKVVQEAIDRINEKYIFWTNNLEAFIRRLNVKLLKDQGYTLKRYKGLQEEKKQEIKSFAEDPEVYDLMKGFKDWIKLFNEIELKYRNIIFYQKRLITDPNNEESKEKLNALYLNLNLI
ncbi:MAG: hypothetical protein ACTSPD_04990 [Promethearchaeota archaeon]